MGDVERDGVPCKTSEDGQTLDEQNAAVYRRAQVPRLPPLEENERLRRQLMGAVDALDFALRIVSDPDLTEAEIRGRIRRVVGKTLARLGGQ
jgi:hypothetical protein